MVVNPCSSLFSNKNASKVCFGHQTKRTYFRKAKFNDRWPLPMGVINGPFNPIVFLLTESMAAWGIPNFPSIPRTGVTSTGSQEIGTWAAAKIFWTAAEISGPIPSPGMRVTVRLEACLILRWLLQAFLCCRIYTSKYYNQIELVEL